MGSMDTCHTSSVCSMYVAWEREWGSSMVQLGPAMVECAAHVEAGSMEKVIRCLARVTGLIAVAGAGADGAPLRLAMAMADILARRLLRPMPAIARALIDPSDHLDRRSVRAARRCFFDLSPFPKVAFAVANRAILEAMDNQKNVHVIDFSGPAAQPRQWIQLLHDFHHRPEGPPHLRLTVVHDDEDLLARMSKSLVDEAAELDMAFQFHGVVGQLEDLDFSDLHRCLGVKSGEARAVSCTLQLHRLLADDDGSGYSPGAAQFNQTASITQLQQIAVAAASSWPSTPSSVVSALYDDGSYRSPATPLSFLSPPASTPHFQMPAPMARFLSAVRALSPEVVVLTEQDANHSGFSFRRRFTEALYHYAAVYDSLDAAAAGAGAGERVQAERVAVGEEMKGVLLREGARRRERHERVHQWALRMGLGGFAGVPLSYIAIRRGNDVLDRCGLRPRCENREYAGCLLLCWSSRPLYSVSAWRPSTGEAGRWPAEASAEARGGVMEA